MKDFLLSIGIFFITLFWGFLLRWIWNLLRKPTHNETVVNKELYAVTVYQYRAGRYSPGGRWYEYSFIKKGNHWKYRISKSEALIDLLLFAGMMVVLGFVCVNSENGREIFTRISTFMAAIYSAAILVGPLSAFFYVLKLVSGKKRKKSGR